MVTGSTLHKERLVNSPEKLTLVEAALFDVMEEFGWQLQAWAVFANHYHFVGLAPEEPRLSEALNKLHTCTSRELNKMDEAPGRKVWFQFWDNRVTFANSYWARMSYVHRNPVRHGLVPRAELYEWCSAKWFFEKAPNAFYERIMDMKIDNVNVYDDFD